MANDQYKACISEVFIEPIRSVLIVDDEYPTWGKLLEPPQTGDATRNRPAEHNVRDRFGDMIDSFHKRQPPLLVDIHDGTDVRTDGPTAATSRLHQTDLLVLDFELDPSRGNDGTRAVEILRVLLASAQFNLVMVRTKEDLDRVFDSVRLGLLGPWNDPLPEDERTRATQLLADADDEVEGFQRKLLETVDLEQYFAARRHPKYARSAIKGEAPYGAYAGCCLPTWKPQDRRIVLRYLLERVERRHRHAMSVDAAADISWSTSSDRWIRSDSVFIGFCGKADTTEVLPELHRALTAWCPQPSRLFLAKLRNAVESYGILARTQALNRRYAFAYWYHRLLLADEPERRWNVKQTVSRHAEELLSCVLPEVEDFASRLIAAEVDTADSRDICAGHFEVNLRNTTALRCAELQHNALVCSTEPTGWHLTLGHVFRMNGQHWICLSAACDMVPSQVSKWRMAVSGQELPFLAVRLTEVNSRKRLEGVQTNRYVFLTRNDSTAVFSFSDGPSASPEWHVLHAANGGRFRNGGFQLDVFRTEMGTRRPIVVPYAAQVVGQLRYEYALNLAQKLGAFVTRVGLEFVSSGPLGALE